MFRFLSKWALMRGWQYKEGRYKEGLLYFDLIEEVKVASVAEKKTSRQYYVLGRYEILQCGDFEKLIKKRKSESETSYFAHIDEMFDIIKRAHISTGHGGRDKMVKALVKYANVTRDAIELYKSLCMECQKKRKRVTTKGVVVKPIVSKDYLTRGQVDLVDMQSMACGSNKWIMVYQDHFTKFCVLRPLTSKRACEVAYQLMDIFLLLGAPTILQSDNGSEFTASVITELKLMWSDLVMVHGKPRHPQSQGSVERLNCDVKDMLVAWLGDNNTTEWPVGLKFVQFQKNNSYHSTIKMSPFKALFGSDPKVGLRSLPLPDEILQRLVSEDDLLQALSAETPQTASNNLPDSTPATSETLQDNLPDSTPATSETLQDNLPDSTPATSETVQDNLPDSATSETVQDNLPDSATSETASVPFSEAEHLETQHATIMSCRKRAADGILTQAERMIKRSRIINVAANPGDNVTVPIPMVDRGKGDPRNIMGVVLDRNDSDLYKIGVQAGVLKGRYARNQFDLCPQKLYCLSDISTEKEVGLRQAVQSESKCGGQGYTRCNCSKSGKQCVTNKCKCYKSGVLCNSRCHNSANCKNKNC